jgi:N-acetylneuraminic acid mutarotase
VKIIFILLFSLLGFTSFAQVTLSSKWTWMKGDSVLDVRPIYGTQGVADPLNKPGSRWESTSWKDNAGNLWLFGGHGFASAGGTNYLNDFWKYEIATNEWTWVKGENTVNSLGIYGIKGVANAANKPGAREGAISWTDSFGNLWLFGGFGYAASGYADDLNDLWKYDPLNNVWTWMKGDNSGGQWGIYGNQGVADIGNNPGSRSQSSAWLDKVGDLWLFGGEGTDGAGFGGMLNDLWKYNLSTNQWTWVKGDSTWIRYGEYGLQGIPAITNNPGGRNRSVTWTDAMGNLWLFGGEGQDTSDYGTLSDLWKYDPFLNQWAWMKGDQVINKYGIYGTQGVGASSNKPGCRQDCLSWTDASGKLWLWGGFGYDASFGLTNLSDLWRYDPSTNMWTWIKGSNSHNESGVYGTQGVSSSTNKPGAGANGNAWIDNTGNFWLFGGYRMGTSIYSDYSNDLWRLSRCGFTWIGVTSTDWMVGSNWCGGVVPGGNDDAVVPGGTPFSAILPNGITTSVRSLTITTGATVTIGTNSHLYVMH